jgi:hypothetical protein
MMTKTMTHKGLYRTQGQLLALTVLLPIRQPQAAAVMAAAAVGLMLMWQGQPAVAACGLPAAEAAVVVTMVQGATVVGVTCLQTAAASVRAQGARLATAAARLGVRSTCCSCRAGSVGMLLGGVRMMQL